MTGFQRILSAILASLTLLSCISCSTETDDTPEEQSGQTTSAEADTQFFPPIEKTDYNEATFCMKGATGNGSWYMADEYKTNTSGGNSIHVLNNTLYEMNQLVEEHLNVVLVPGEEIGTAVDTSIMAGDDTYQAVLCHAYWDVASYVTRNFMLDMTELEDIDFSQPYWNGPVIEELSIDNKRFVAVGDICWSVLHMIYTNKDLMADHNMAMPYDKVRNGEWTFSELSAMTADVHVDDGDGLRNNKDVYGFLGQWADWGAVLPQAAGIFIAEKNSEGGFDLSLYNDRTVDFYDQIYEWSCGQGVWLMNFGDPDEKMINFKDGSCCLYGDILGSSFLDVEFKLGILPMPKYDVAQENYSHVNWGHELLVPTTVKNRAMVGQVLELMSFYSGTMVREKYYDEVLQLRVSEAPDDRDMVEIIYNTVVYDPGMVYAHAGGTTTGSLYPLVYLFYRNIEKGQSSFVSDYKAYAKGAQKQIDNVVKRVIMNGDKQQ